jgi:hypothetical protein
MTEKPVYTALSLIPPVNVFQVIIAGCGLLVFMLNWLGFWGLHLGFFLLGWLLCLVLDVATCLSGWGARIIRAIFMMAYFFAIARKLFVVLPHAPFLCKFRWTLPPCVAFRTKLYLNLPRKTILIATREVVGCCWDGDIHGRLRLYFISNLFLCFKNIFNFYLIFN